MPINLSSLADATRVLFSIPLRPLQGERFQPTGFPNLGAATFQTKTGTSLLVESVQSMANRMEAVCWDEEKLAPREPLTGLSYVRVERGGKFLTSSMTEAHRLNSPYVLEGKDKKFFNTLKEEFGALEEGPIDRKLLAKTLLKYDVNCLLHGVFLAKKELAGGRLRVARALSAFIEASQVQVAPSGGVKNDHVNPSGSAKDGFGNVPFARDEFTALGDITLYVNLDLGQIRSYGLGENVEHMLTLLALYKIRALLEGNLRLRTACDFKVATDEPIRADSPPEFTLPSLAVLEAELPEAIAACRKEMTVTTVTYENEIKKAKDTEGRKTKASDEDDDASDAEED